MAATPNKVISIAAAEVGYKEKATNYNLDDKTANAGSGNYTKYAAEIDKSYPQFYNGRKNGYAWCDLFVDWCFLKAYGYEKALQLLCQPEKSAGTSCTASCRYFREKGQFYTSNPKPGDQIFFGNGINDCEHTGIVEDVMGSSVYTIEGNASNDVSRRRYSVNNKSIVGYGRPNYECDDPLSPNSPYTKGIDIYSGSGSIDFEKIKAAGYSFAIIRAGYGRYIEQKDERFEEHYRKAKAAGLNVGAYWFSYATTVAQAEAEADICIQVLKGKQYEYPIFFDLETQAAFDTGKTNVSNMIMAFGKKLEAAGYFTGLYMSTYYLTNYVSDEVKRKFTLWVAQYASTCSYSGVGRIDIWQFSESGKVPGCPGNTDLDECYYDYPTVIKEKHLNGFGVSTVKGDVNLDGKVTADDARAILRASAGLEKLDGQAAKNADMNDDGKITAEDARSALRKSAGLE